jgi:5-methylcytosine-specific restriction endonuclease McrA
MPKGKPQYCKCGCGVTPTNYRKKFFDTWSSGYPLGDGMYYCANYGQTDSKGNTCLSVAYDRTDSSMHVDHIWPKADGGDDCINNLRPMCMHCNTSKNDNPTKTSYIAKQKNNAGQMKSYHKRKLNKS